MVTKKLPSIKAPLRLNLTSIRPITHTTLRVELTITTPNFPLKDRVPYWLIVESYTQSIHHAYFFLKNKDLTLNFTVEILKPLVPLFPLLFFDLLLDYPLSIVTRPIFEANICKCLGIIAHGVEAYLHFMVQERLKFVAVVKTQQNPFTIQGCQPGLEEQMNSTVVPGRGGNSCSISAGRKGIVLRIDLCTLAVGASIRVVVHREVLIDM